MVVSIHPRPVSGTAPPYLLVSVAVPSLPCLLAVAHVSGRSPLSCRPVQHLSTSASLPPQPPPLCPSKLAASSSTSSSHLGGPVLASRQRERVARMRSQPGRGPVNGREQGYIYIPTCDAIGRNDSCDSLRHRRRVLIRPTKAVTQSRVHPNSRSRPPE